ncbi:ABC transporter permease [Erysipelothrix sp. HDW6A]|uniref:ABC transporter permease n=1 Tax=Erysipelothrix sp. HDW6A TaxID=2714928 RepID=UPI00140A4AD3|nr:ABC transporter permease [Erysipelothrix sp. HDW6A]QIK58109.1 ABC transporter permease [Erysipelothrix sp. HDW6A]
MKLSFHKLKAVLYLKVRMLMNNTSALSAPLMGVIMTVIIRILYTSLADGDSSRMDMLLGMALNLGLSFNIGMGAVMMTSLPLAEEKEKHTLRALMTSSVNGLEFFLGSLIPPFIITVIMNFVLIFVSGIDIANINFLTFTFVTVISSLSSCMLGLVIGIMANSQVNASNIMSPFIFILSLLPTFSQFNESIDNLSNYLYTGIVEKMINSFMSGGSYIIHTQQVFVLISSLVVFSVVFIYFYQKSGFEQD